jgi:very-short-patch-repair endonuclease
MEIVFILIIIVLYALFKVLYNNNIILREKSDKYFNGKLNTKILTENELNFYEQLKIITDKHNLIIFSKIRVADLIKTDEITEFNRIKSKHIDFIICKKDTSPILFLELDDSTHNHNKNKQNDIKKDNIFYSVGKKIIRYKVEKAYNFEELENRITSNT